MKKGELPKIDNVTSDHILKFEMDGQPFDATRITRAVLLKYHLKWADFYKNQPGFNESELEPRPEERQAPAFQVITTTSQTGWIAKELLPVMEETEAVRNRAPFLPKMYKRVTTASVQVTEADIMPEEVKQDKPDDTPANQPLKTSEYATPYSTQKPKGAT